MFLASLLGLVACKPDPQFFYTQPVYSYLNYPNYQVIFQVESYFLKTNWYLMDSKAFGWPFAAPSANYGLQYGPIQYAPVIKSVKTVYGKADEKVANPIFRAIFPDFTSNLRSGVSEVKYLRPDQVTYYWILNFKYDLIWVVEFNFIF